MRYRRFGKGTGHPARLNMGDCFAYALARDLGEPLLFKGDDFRLTDIETRDDPDPSETPQRGRRDLRRVGAAPSRDPRLTAVV